MSDELWAIVAPLFPAPPEGPPRPGRLRLPDRLVLNGVLFVAVTGIAWERLPSELGYGSGTACWRRLDEWRAQGRWPAIEAAVVEHLERTGRAAEAHALQRASIADEDGPGAGIGPLRP